VRLVLFISSRTKVASFSSLKAPASCVPPKHSKQGFLFEKRCYFSYYTVNLLDELYAEKTGLTVGLRGHRGYDGLESRAPEKTRTFDLCLRRANLTTIAMDKALQSFVAFTLSSVTYDAQ